MVSTQNEILDYIIKQTEIFDANKIKEFSANTISNKLKISRSLASQYLNEFVKEKILIKISSRPVYFLYKKNIEEQFQIKISNNVFYSIDEFLHEIAKNKRCKYDFMKLIGFDGSLKFCIDQIKTSLKYPPAGLPIILYGENGTGKTSLCKMMKEYAANNKIINENEKYFVIEIPEDARKANDLLDKLINYSDNKYNSIEDFHGILCINKAQNLTIECQNKLQPLIEDYVYNSAIGMNKKLNSHLVLVMNTIPEDTFSSRFLQCFPVVCRIPTLEERNIQEKEELIVHFFKKEAIEIHRNFLVSKSVMRILLSMKFKQNIIDLRKTIKSICAKANFNEEEKLDKNLYVKLYEMPEDILMNLSDTDLVNEEKIDYINIYEYKKSDDSERVIDLFDSIIDRYKNTVKTLKDTEIFMKDVMVNLKQYYEYLVFEKKYSNSQIKAIEHSVNLIVEKVLNMYSVNLPVNCIVITSRIIYLLSEANSDLNIWEKERKQDIQTCLNALNNYYTNESFIVERINQCIKSNLEFELDNMNKILLILNLSYYNNEITQRKYLSIIISHGYATASSMADAVNSLIGSYVFDAFDMPLNTSMPDIVEKLQRYISRTSVKRDVILLVDMGSLEDINNQIGKISNKNIGIINNVSTRLALEVGELIIQGAEMEYILNKASNDSKSIYKIVKNESPKGTIIFTSENGLSMANRIKDLFVKSLPCPIDVDIITMDYNELSSKEIIKSLLNECNILFISGTFDPSHKEEIFVPIEEIVSLNNIDKIQKELSVYMNPKQLEVFSQNIIRNFSFENLVGNLTILDANKLLDFVEDSIEQIQMKLGVEFNGRTKVGMYIHMSCLVERLVIKEPIEDREGIEKFKIEQEKFIEIVKESFNKISKHYGVEIPISEIAYLHDYIMADKNLE